MAYATTLLDVKDNIRDLYVFNLRSPTSPCPSGLIQKMLKQLAKQANLQILVHPHSFRHTIVGKLIACGNKMEIVSKFMGHKDTMTTSKNYWVANVLDLQEQMNSHTLIKKINDRNQTKH